MDFEAIVQYIVGKEDLLAHLAGGNSIVVQQRNEETGELEEYRVSLPQNSDITIQTDEVPRLPKSIVYFVAEDTKGTLLYPEVNLKKIGEEGVCTQELL